MRDTQSIIDEILMRGHDESMSKNELAAGHGRFLKSCMPPFIDWLAHEMKNHTSPGILLFVVSCCMSSMVASVIKNCAMADKDQQESISVVYGTLLLQRVHRLLGTDDRPLTADEQENLEALNNVLSRVGISKTVRAVVPK